MTTKDENRCPSIHALGGMRCIRHAGHDGDCWARAILDRTGAMTRGEWQSVNGVYKRHLQYRTSYTKPLAKRREKGEGR